MEDVDATRAWTISTVAVCGAVLMSAEFAGARMLEAHWGSSLIVWGSTIAVVLGGMAAGYTAGGRLADRRPGPPTLIALLVAAAATLLVVAFAGAAVLRTVADLLPGPRAGSLTGALLVLAAPAAVLAAVSPVALKAVLTPEAAGHDAGRVYTAGTAGSIVGTLGAAFWLVELTGLRGLLAGCAAVLVACAAAGLLVGSRNRAGWLLLALGLPLTALLAAALNAVSSDASRPGVRAAVETGEVSVRVVDDGPIRRLVFPGELVQSEQDLRRPLRLRLRYTHAVHGAACRARPPRLRADDRRRRRLAGPLAARGRPRRARRRGRVARAGAGPRAALVRPAGRPVGRVPRRRRAPVPGRHRRGATT